MQTGLFYHIVLVTMSGYYQLYSNKTVNVHEGLSSQLEGRKEMFLFNGAFNTFYFLRLYGIRHMVKDHSDSNRKLIAAAWATLSD